MANKFTLTAQDINALVLSNNYPVTKENQFLSRCIDGRYQGTNLPPVAIPGGDAGELGILYACANKYGFEIDYDKAFEILTEIVGGIKNFSLHTDQRGDTAVTASGCGHIKQIRLDPKAYNVTQEQVDVLNKQIQMAREKGATEVMLEGEHIESAVVMVEGERALAPRYMLDMAIGKREVEVFVFNSTLVSHRHKVFSQKLVENDAVKLLEGCDAEYLYQVMSDTTDEHVMETARRLAPELPIYAVAFDATGNFTVEDLKAV